MTEIPMNAEEQMKPKLTYGKDYVTLSEGNIPEVEQFIGAKLEDMQNGWYGFPNDGRSRRVRTTDRLTLEGGEVIVWPIKSFKEEFDTNEKDKGKK